MPQEEIAVIIAKLDGLREIMELRFDQNEECHRKVDEHLTKLNGQTAKNTVFRERQLTNNKWIYSLMTLIVIPVIFLIIKQYV